MSGAYTASPDEIRHFMSITNCGHDQAKFMLEASHGNETLAMGMLSAPQAGQPGLGQGLMLVEFPLSIIRLLGGLVTSVVLAIVSILNRMYIQLVPGPARRRMTGLVRSHDIDSSEQARCFIQQFKAKFGDRHPRFIDSGIRQSTSAAKEQHRFLFTYLHSPEHQDSAKFCEDVLCSPVVVEYVNEHFVCWGGDVTFTDPYVLATRLSVTSYPHIALLNVASDNRVQVVASLAGCVNVEKLLAAMMNAQDEQGALLVAQRAEKLLEAMTNAQDEQGALLVAQRAEVQERDFNRRLLAEQNDEYEASLAADREREARRQKEREAEEAERKAQEEAEAIALAELAEQKRLVAEAAEAEAKRNAELEASLEARRAEKKLSLPEEPGPEVSSSFVALVRVRLPDGTSCQRRFLASHNIGNVFDLVYSLDSTNYHRFSLVSNYPRKTFNAPDDVAVTLEEAGFTPNGSLFRHPAAVEQRQKRYPSTTRCDCPTEVDLKPGSNSSSHTT
eukprot:gene9156-16281_t